MNKKEKKALYSELAKIWRFPSQAYTAWGGMGVFLSIMTYLFFGSIFWALILFIFAILVGFSLEYFKTPAQLHKTVFFLSLYKAGRLRTYYVDDEGDSDVNLRFFYGKGCREDLTERVIHFHREFWQYIKKYTNKQSHSDF